jgi:AraC family transcriptional regulator
MVEWPGQTIEIVEASSPGRVELSFHGRTHLLVFYEHGLRYDGETYLEGGVRPQVRKLSNKFFFVPAGYVYTEWHELSAPLRIVFFYLAEGILPRDQTQCVSECTLTYRLFEDEALQGTAGKLIRSIQNLEADQHTYVEALGHVLVHELRSSLCQRNPTHPDVLKGGLASWQERVLSSYIDEHLKELIPLSRLASLVGLSTYHCCRAFKKSFGAPPRRYQTNRRIDRAKILLAGSTLSVTEIGEELGFGETSAFSNAFRRLTGWTPSEYRRNIV